MSEEGEVVVNQPTEAEIKAAEFGWVPKDQFKGPEEDWKPAEEFLKRGEEINGFLRKHNERLEEKNRRLAAELAEIRNTIEEFRKFHKESLAQATKRAVEDLKRQQAEALEQGDGQRFVEINEQIETIKNESKSSATEEKKVNQEIIFTPQEFNAWNRKNSWYGQNQEMSEFADELADVLLVKQPNLRGEDFLDALTKRVKRAFPEAFENPARQIPDVGGSGEARSSGKSKKKSYENLPEEAKRACDNFVRRGLITKEEYVAQYDWD
jgi:hypothetical protein